MKSGRLRYFAIGLATAAVYVASAKIGLRLAYVAEQVTVVWPPTGIALSALLLFGTGIWPFIALGAFIANITTNTPVLTSLGIATGNTLEALLGAYLLTRIVGFRSSIDRFKDVFGLVFFGAMISTMVSATIGVTSLCIAGMQPWQRFGSLWSLWFLGDGMGDMVFAPVVLTLFAPESRKRVLARAYWELGGLVAILIAVDLNVFAQSSPAGARYNPPAYAVFPALIWTALRFGPCGTAISTAITATIAVLGTVQGFGPFSTATTHENLIALELFMFVVAATGLLMAASQMERESAAVSLHDSEQRYKSLVLASSQVVWSTNAPGEVVDDLPMWRSFTGQTSEEMMGRGWMKKIHPEDLERVGQVWEQSLATSSSHENEFRVMGADGTYRNVIARAVPILDSAGRVRDWVGTLTDITVREKAEREMREANQRKDEFLAMLAHELRNPLAPIRNAVAIIRSPKADTGKISWACDVMERQIQHMSRLLDDLLDLARITHGQIQLSKQPVDFKALVRRGVDTMRIVLEQKELRIGTDFTPGNVPVSADVTRIEQVITNLLNNAAKFTPSGGLISIHVDRDDNWAVLRVRDTGRGIAPELLPNIFDLFTQGDRSLARSEGGLGIGLTLVQNLVRMHDGLVEARSAGPGLGSEFIVRLPLLATESVQVSATAADSPLGDRKKRVLVVEDNVDSAETMAGMLEMMGHVPYVAYDGPAALVEFARVKPSVVLLDIGLPGMSGYEVAQQLRSVQSNDSVRLIAVTGYGNDSDREQTKAAGFDHHLVKPVDFEVLEKMVSG